MALIPPQFLDCVVAIGFANKYDEIKYDATGFLVGKFVGEEKETKNKQYSIFLVSNKHVFEDADKVWLRFNSSDGLNTKEFKIDLVLGGKRKILIEHPQFDVDLAAISLNGMLMRKEGIHFEFFKEDENLIAGTNQAISVGIGEGDGVFVLGFPMGLVGENRNYIVVRHGIIARIKSWFRKATSEILIDSTIYPGNSGGPVLTKPETTSIVGTKPNTSSFLLGVVSSYIPYRDEAISKQTKMTRIVFEENSGLTKVVPASYIVELINDVAKAHEEKFRE